MTVWRIFSVTMFSPTLLVRATIVPSCAHRSTEAYSALLLALDANPGLRELDVTCCALFLADQAPEPAVSLPALRTLTVSPSTLC